jgi:hypothetical protein
MTSQSTSEESKTQSLLQQADAQSPAPDEAFLAILRQSSAQAFAHAPLPSQRKPSHRRLITWLAPLAALVAIAMAIAFWPSGATQALAWPQVKEQLQLAQELQFTFTYSDSNAGDDDDDDAPSTKPAKTTRRNSAPGGPYRVSYLAPDRFRIEQLSSDPNTPPQLLMISAGGKTLIPEPRSQLYIIEKTKRRQIQATQNALTILATIGGASASPMLGSLESPDLQLKPGLDFPLGGALRGKPMRLVRVTPKGELPFCDFFGVNLVFNEKNQIVTGYLIKNQRVIATLTPNLTPKLDPALFELKGPPGYTDVEQGIFPRLPADVRPIADAYYNARQRLTHYRMAVIPGHDGRRSINVHYRQVRDGELWRLDKLDIFAMTGKNQFYFNNPEQLSFDAVWSVVGAPDFPVDAFVLTYKNNLAHATNYEKKPRSGWLIPPISIEISEEANKDLANRKNRRWYDQAPEMTVGSMAQYDLRQLAWPSFVGDRLLAPHGWDIGSPPPVYYTLPARSDRPGLLGIRAVSRMELTEYWIDPAKDHLCIHYVQYFDKLEPWKPDPQAFDSIAYYAAVKRKPSEPEPVVRRKHEIKETAQTSDGRWYPKTFTNGTFVFLDTQGPIDPAFFAWPANIPEPGTGKGIFEMGRVYTVGTPEANESQARQLTERRLYDIKTAIERYKRDHNNAWPDSLAQLVELTYLTTEGITAPRRAPATFLYRKPKSVDKSDHTFKLVLYEPPDPWPAGLNSDLPSGIHTIGLLGEYLMPRFLKTQQEFENALPK